MERHQALVGGRGSRGMWARKLYCAFQGKNGHGRVSRLGLAILNNCSRFWGIELPLAVCYLALV